MIRRNTDVDLRRLERAVLAGDLSLVPALAQAYLRRDGALASLLPEDMAEPVERDFRRLMDAWDEFGPDDPTEHTTDIIGFFALFESLDRLAGGFDENLETLSRSLGYLSATCDACGFDTPEALFQELCRRINEPPHYTVRQFKAMPTIESGHFDDEKFNDGGWRISVSRQKVADGAPCNHAVTVERMFDFEWHVHERYCPKAR